MTKNEFMAKLTDELKKRNIEDAADVAEEYEQHFAFKLADGYSEEEIAAKLGDPTALAAQFDMAAQGVEKRSAVLTWLWLWLADFVFGMASVLLLAFGVVLAACVLSFGLTGVCLIFDLGRLPFVSLPAMPHLRRDTRRQPACAGRAVRCRVHLVLRVRAADIPRLWPLPQKRAGPLPRHRGASRAAPRAAASRRAAPPSAHGDAGRARGVCRVLRACLYRVQPVRRKP